MARVFSGIQPSGEMHLGNYLGAVRNWVREQDAHDTVYCVVDLHAMTLPYDAATLGERTIRTAALLIAAGLDPERCTLFVQSHVVEHAQLSWLLECTAAMGELRRMVQFKDKSTRGGDAATESVSVGLFTYPVLQAADILLYDTDRVPVGEDQRQHIELSRDLGQRFNHRYGETFVLPEAVIPPVGARVMDLQNPRAKMSKSVESPQGTIVLIEDPASIAKKIKSAVTDSGRDVRFDVEEKPGISNLLGILSAVTDTPIDALVETHGELGYGAFKSFVADAVVEFLRPLQARYAALMSDPGEMRSTLARGASKAREVAVPTYERAARAAGLLAG